MNRRGLKQNPAVSTVISDLDSIFDLAEGMTGSMAPADGQQERDRIARARREVPKMLARLQALEGALKRVGKKDIKS